MATTKYLTLEGLQHFVEKLYARGFNGLGLSQENFTTALLNKLNSTATTEGMAELTARVAAVEALIESDADGAINKFNEIVKFLEGIANAEGDDNLKKILAAKANSATTLAGYGINDAKIVDGTITLGGATITPLTAHQDISGKVDKEAGKGLSANDYTDADKAAVDTIADKLNAADIVAITNAEIDTILNA